MSELMRREWRLEDWWAAAAECEADAALAPGMSRMLSLRPVVGSTVNSRAGSCETW
jgi:hypothetical protein